MKKFTITNVENNNQFEFKANSISEAYPRGNPKEWGTDPTIIETDITQDEKDKKDKEDKKSQVLAQFDSLSQSKKQQVIERVIKSLLTTANIDLRDI